MSRLSRYAPVFLRLSLAGVYIWFGVSQLTEADLWISMVPDWATNMTGLSAAMIVNLNGWFEVVAGIALILGIFVRLLGFILGMHLMVISYELGINAIGVRDLGLAGATLALALFGADDFSLSKYIQNRRRNTSLNA